MQIIKLCGIGCRHLLKQAVGIVLHIMKEAAVEKKQEHDNG